MTPRSYDPGVALRQTSTPRQRASGGLGLLAAALVAALLCRPVLGVVLDPAAALTAWSTVFLAVVVQALPFLALGVVLSSLVATFLPARLLAYAGRGPGLVTVPVAAATGALVPGCECASVPVANRLLRRGVPAGTAVAFLLSAPAVNPVVLVATAVAFPHRPGVVLARAGASLATAAVVGWLWPRLGRRSTVDAQEHQAHRASFVDTARHDLFQAGGFLVIGAGAAATVNVTVPPGWLRLAGGAPWLAVPVMAVLAVLLCVCSQADAFVASSLTGLPVTAQLAFMVVGPAVDVKLVALQTGTFGRPFATRLAGLAFLVALTASDAHPSRRVAPVPAGVPGARGTASRARFLHGRPGRRDGTPTGPRRHLSPAAHGVTRRPGGPRLRDPGDLGPRPHPDRPDHPPHRLRHPGHRRGMVRGPAAHRVLRGRRAHRPRRGRHRPAGTGPRHLDHRDRHLAAQQGPGPFAGGTAPRRHHDPRHPPAHRPLRVTPLVAGRRRHVRPTCRWPGRAPVAGP